MVTILYHSTSTGYVCKKMAAAQPDEVKVLYDKGLLPQKVSGTLVRWDSKTPLKADKYINILESVKLSRNKRESRLAMAGLCPTTWISSADITGYPVLVRPARHYAAQGFHVCKTLAQVKAAIKQCGAGKWYASPLIEKAAEYRVFVFQGHVVKVVRRYPGEPGQLAWNIAVGGKTVRVTRESWPLEVVRKAIKAVTALKLDFCAADVIVDGAGKAYVLELNTAPGLQRPKTLETLAKLFVWADSHDAPAMPNMSSTSWKGLIHPAVKNSEI